MKRTYFISILSFLIFFGIYIPNIRSQEMISVRIIEVIEVKENKLIYSTYKLAGTNEVDLSELIISPDIIGKGNPFNVVYWHVPDFKLLLLKNGYAKLKNTTSAPSHYLSAQNEAKRKKLVYGVTLNRNFLKNLF